MFANVFSRLLAALIDKGKIYIVIDRDEMMRRLLLLSEKYSPGIDPDAEISKCINHVSVLRLDIDRVTGKEAIELVRKRKESDR